MPFTPSAPRLWWEPHGAEGPPVVLIMGFAMRAILWRSQIEALRPDHRVVIFDHQGMGESECGSGLLHMTDMAADAVRVMDAAGLDSAHVVGVSMGGMVAQELALQWPHRVRSLGLIVTHAGGRGARRPPLEGLRKLIEANVGPRERRAMALARLLYPDDYLASLDPADLQAHMSDRLARRPASSAVLRQLTAIARHNTTDRLDRLQMPTLVIRAGRDELVSPQHVEWLAEQIPGAQLLNLPDAGHGAIYQRRDAVNAALRSHIQAFEQAGARRQAGA